MFCAHKTLPLQWQVYFGPEVQPTACVIWAAFWKQATLKVYTSIWILGYIWPKCIINLVHGLSCGHQIQMRSSPWFHGDMWANWSEVWASWVLLRWKYVLECWCRIYPMIMRKCLCVGNQNWQCKQKYKTGTTQEYNLNCTSQFLVGTFRRS